MKVILAPFVSLSHIFRLIFSVIFGIISKFLPTNWLMQHSMYGEARRLAKRVVPLYEEYLSRNPGATEAEVVKDMAFSLFNKEDLARLSENSRRRIETCCETIQGFCYMMALDYGPLRSLMTFRCLQFTYYMDRVLEAKGFRPQPKEQKERILEAMELNIPNWDSFTGD